MKKKTKKFAFSLAEALITLLIVCLITLASVPVLTKKRRDLNNAHGMYICTRNSKDEYVYFDKNTGEGDIKNPDSWTKTGTQSCVFTPPKNARNFSVTAIGGGGGGGDGVSKYLTVLSKDNGSGSFSLKNYTDETLESDYYDVLVVGGGGGGGGANNNASKIKFHGPGSGGSGSWSYGKVYLNVNQFYDYSVGGGGSGGQGRYNGGWTKPKTTNWAGDGGGSSFVSQNNTSDQSLSGYVSFSANGGKGAEGLGCGGNFWGTMVCGGGAAGEGGAPATAVATNVKEESLKANWGAGGLSNTWSAKGGTLNLPSFAPVGAGNGGQAASHQYNQSTVGGSGSNGVVFIGQLREWHAKGGESGQLKNQFVASMNGLAKITIAPIAKNGESGGEAVFLLKDKIHAAGLEVKALGGKAGTSDKDLTQPQKGDNSPWSGTGGGTAGPKCTGYKAAHWDSYDVTYEKTVCAAKKCNSTRSVKEDSITKYIRMYYMNGLNKVYLPIQLNAFLPEAKESSYKLPASGNYVTLPSNFLKDYFLALSHHTKIFMPMKCQIIDSGDNVSNVTTTGYISISTGLPYACYIEKNTGCFFDNNNLYYGEEECSLEKSITVTEKQDILIPATPPSCAQAGHGTYFGAGGGGGRANDTETTKNLAGKGGNGAPGAVIIEW